VIPLHGHRQPLRAVPAAPVMRTGERPIHPVLIATRRLRRSAERTPSLGQRQLSSRKARLQPGFSASAAVIRMRIMGAASIRGSDSHANHGSGKHPRQ